MSYFEVNNVCIVNDTYLQIDLQNEGGAWIETTFDLNEVIGVDDDGDFCWDSSGFIDSAQNIWAELSEDGTVLTFCAELDGGDGNFYERRINLFERLVNNDGVLEYQ